MRIPLWLILLLFAGYSIWAVRYWYCYRCDCAGKGAQTTVTETSGIPLFKWGTASPEQDANFGKWKKEQIGKCGPGDTLQITGLYRKGEAKPEGFDNLGLARAAALRSMFAPEVPESRVRLLAREVSDSLTADSRPMPSIELQCITMVMKKEKGAIVESGDTITFFFPFNSTERDRNPEAEAFLQKILEKHKTSQAAFVITGHTDNVGSPASNQAFGLARARSIAKILEKNGIVKTRIQVASKGQTEPIADNNTDDGRQKNRRVVLYSTLNQQ